MNEINAALSTPLIYWSLWAITAYLLLMSLLWLVPSDALFGPLLALALCVLLIFSARSRVSENLSGVVDESTGRQNKLRNCFPPPRKEYVVNKKLHQKRSIKLQEE